jgi:hypothetical protein
MHSPSCSCCCWSFDSWIISCMNITPWSANSGDSAFKYPVQGGTLYALYTHKRACKRSVKKKPNNENHRVTEESTAQELKRSTKNADTNGHAADAEGRGDHERAPQQHHQHDQTQQVAAHVHPSRLHPLVFAVLRIFPIFPTLIIATYAGRRVRQLNASVRLHRHLDPHALQFVHVILVRRTERRRLQSLTAARTKPATIAQFYAETRLTMYRSAAARPVPRSSRFVPTKSSRDRAPTWHMSSSLRGTRFACLDKPTAKPCRFLYLLEAIHQDQ